MSGRRSRQATVPYNPDVDGQNDKVRKEQDRAPPTTRSKRGSPISKPTNRFDPAWEERSDTESKHVRGETPAPSRQTEAQEALDESIEAIFTEQSTGIQAHLV